MNLVRAVIIALVVSPLAFAQTWTFPAKGTGVPCTGCGGTAEGLLTVPYDEPLTRHAGRFVDSTNVAPYLSPVRTLRARLIRVSSDRNRLYFALGSSIAGYSLDTFFTTTLRKPMADVRALHSRVMRDASRYETLAPFDTYFIAEGPSSGWNASPNEFSENLYDFDSDDRGNVYIAATKWRWGIQVDAGAADGGPMDLVHRSNDTSFSPRGIVSIQSGAAYYAAISGDAFIPEVRLYDVTDPSAPVWLYTRTGSLNDIKAWARDDVRQRLAVLHVDGHVRLYDYATYVSAVASPVPTLADLTPAAGSVFADLEFDETGNLWVTQGPASTPGAASFLKLAPADTGYTTTSLTIDGGSFAPQGITVGGGFLAVAGRTSTQSGTASSLRLFRMVQGAPQLLDIGDFFQKYYHATVAQGYARTNRSQFQDLRLVEEGSKTFLMYGAYGLGDVYELQRGDAVKIGTDAALDITPNPSAIGEEVTLTVTVTPDSTGIADPTGAVTFTVNGSPLTTAPLVNDGGVFRATATRTDLGVEVVDIVATYEGDDHYAASPASNTVVHYPATLPAPAGFAAALNGGAIKLTWQPVSGASRYQVLRRHGSAFDVVHDGTFADAPTLSYNDTTVTAGNVYIYRVRAVAPDGTPGFETGADAVGVISFTDPALAAGHPIKAAHILELRAAANAFRVALGLAPITFTDTSLSAGMTVRAMHLNQIRSELVEAEQAVGIVDGPWSVWSPGNLVEAATIVSLRQNLQ